MCPLGKKCTMLIQISNKIVQFVTYGQSWPNSFIIKIIINLRRHTHYVCMCVYIRERDREIDRERQWERMKKWVSAELCTFVVRGAVTQHKHILSHNLDIHKILKIVSFRVRDHESRRTVKQ